MEKLCLIEGCAGKYYCKNYCKRCYERLRNQGVLGGKVRTRTYSIWANMKNRCNSINSPQYKDYGGRGIKVCKGWSDYSAFLADLGESPPGYSIDRINNNGGYWCGHCAECKTSGWRMNCQWATWAEQANNRRNSRWIEYSGKKQTIAQWANELSLGHECIRQRLARGWTVEKSLTTASQKRR